MHSIALPQKIEFERVDAPHSKKVVIEPLSPGYGITLGNALRRVLLASLPGAAVIGVKIKGADHEFMALPNVKEDVLQIVLNLKQLRLQISDVAEGVVKLELEARGEKQVKASDIKKDSQVKIVNPELVLAHITDMAGSLNLEIYVARGLGYETIESRESKNKEIGYIEIDSIYSPVLAVGLNVENMRVGKMTNWDKLILDVTTDGSITPEEAFRAADQILVAQFASLIAPKAEREVIADEAVSEEINTAEVEPEVEVKEKKTRKRKKKDEEAEAVIE